MTMETLEYAELCFPHLNNSCRKSMPTQNNSILLSTLIFISLLTASLNLLVIISISHFRQLHTPTNLLILSLAFSDFLVGLVLMPGEILITGNCWFLGEVMCALYQSVDIIILTFSVLNMVIISIDRYLAVCQPLQYTTRVTVKRIIICICLLWICIIIYVLIILYDFLREPYAHNSCYGQCIIIHNVIAASFDFALTTVCSITVIIVLHVKIFLVVVSQARAMRSHGAGLTKLHSVGATAKKSEMKAARILGIVVIVFLSCILPYYYAASVDQHRHMTFETWLYYSNSCINPLIYASFYPWFRKSIKVIATFQIFQPGSRDIKVM